MSARLILKEIGSRINNIGTIVDTDPNNDETTSYAGKMLQGTGAFGGGLKDIKDNFSSKDAASAAGDAKDAASTASAAKDVASAASDKNIKDIDKTSNTADIIEKAYKGLDDIIYKYNSKGQAFGEDLIQVSEFTRREVLLKGANPNLFDDDKAPTPEFISQANQNRQLKLAEIKAQAEQRKQQQAAPRISQPQAPASTPSRFDF